MSPFEPRASPTPGTFKIQPEPPSLLDVRDFVVSLSFVVLLDPQSTWNTKAKSQKGEAAYLLTVVPRWNIVLDGKKWVQIFFSQIRWSWEEVFIFY